MAVSVVVPVYGAGEALEELVRRVASTLDGLGAAAWELVFVNDGSAGGTWSRILALAASEPRVRGLDLARNFGQHNALLAGIRVSRGEVIVTIDDDLQHPPEEIPALLAALEAGLDLAYGAPRSPAHSASRNVASVLGKAALSSVFGASLARQVSAFRAFRGDLRPLFARFDSSYVSIDVVLSWGAARIGAVPVRHDPRRHGRTQYTFRKLVLHWLNMVTGFSIWPLRAASLLGFVFIVFAMLVLAWVVGRYLILGGSVPGFPFLASVITLFSGVQLFALGVIGEYVARLHMRTLDRPPYLVVSTVNLGKEG